MSPGFWEILGYDPSEKNHDSKEWQTIIFEDDLKKANDNFEKHLEDPNHPYDQIVRYRHIDGSVVWIHCRGIAVRKDDGTPIRMLGAHTDITAIKEKEALLKASEARQRSIVESLEAGIVIHGPEGTILDSNDRAPDILGVNKEQLLGQTSKDFKWVFVDENKKPLAIEDYPVNRVLKNKKPIKHQTIGVFHPVDDRLVWTTLNGVPIFDSRGTLSEVVISFVDITETIESQKQIAESESRFRKLFEKAPYGYQSLDVQGHILEVNEKWLEIFGYAKQEVIGKWFGDLVLPEIHPAFTQRFEQFKKNGHMHTELSMKTKQGDPIQVGFDGRIAYDEFGEVIQTHCTVSNITEINLAKQRLKQSEEKYRTLHDTMIQGVVYQDSDGTIVSCNPAAEKILGLTLAQMQGKTSTDPRWKMIDEAGNAVPGEHHPAMMALKTKEKVGPVVRGVYHPEKESYVWLNIIAIPLFKKGQKKPCQVYATLEDITDKLKAENKLHYQHTLMDYVIEHMNTGVAVHDKDLNYLYVSDMYKKQYNVDDAIIGRHHYEVFPDLPEKWRKVHQRSLKGEIISSDRDKFVHEDGHVDWTRWESRPWYDEHGNIGGIIIYTEVINAYIEKEEALREINKKLKQSEEQYRLLTTKMQLGLTLNEIICDDQGTPVDFRFISVNESWEKLMGVNKDEVIGKTVLEVFPNTEKSWIETFGDAALNGTSTKIENYSKVLDRYLSMAVYSPKKGQFATVVEDVTEKRKQEKMLDYSLKHDALTGLPNRQYYDEKLHEFDRETHYPLVIVMMDINGLKLINDSLGQEAGNRVLKRFSEILEEEKRKEDFIARISGDEFVMLRPRSSSEATLHLKQLLSERILEERIENIEYSIAIGFASKERSTQDLSQKVMDAENAMYKNKIVYGQGTRSAAIDSVFSTLTNKYAYEKTHSQRVARYSRLIGEQLHLREDEVDELELAGRLHDIGKIAISDDIIMKPGKLSYDEWEKVKDHTVIGYQILKAADKYSNLAEYAMSHHERMDGKGYPNQLKGKAIPLFARVICVADAYEAMTSNRTYRTSMKKEKAIQELVDNSGTQFDPEIVDIFIHEVLPNEPPHKQNT